MWGPEPEPPGNEGADSRQLPLPEPAAQVTREEAGHRCHGPVSHHQGRALPFWEVEGMGGPSLRGAAVPSG